ncbi:MAG TPA: glycerophosphodiester phosphodiesterase [Mycobacteriales bacterium]|nr:glycerophosphodiester phosphodiesterase [Mycobacteriales bacterium]
MEVIGHRGCVGRGHVENSTRAVVEALRTRATGVEVDVRVTLDGIAVCCHDPTLWRVAGVPLFVERSRSEAVAEVRVAGVRSAPPLAQIATMVSAARRLLIAELKPSSHPAPVVVAAALAALGDYPNAVISSFDPRLLAEVHRVAPNRNTALVTGRAVAIHDAVLAARALRCTEIHPHVARLTEQADSLSASAGLRVVAWTVRTLTEAERLLELPVAGVICDEPRLMRSALARRRQAA